MGDRKNVLVEIRSNLLSPYSPVITLIIGLLLTLLATGSNLPWYIDIFVNNKTILLIMIIFWLIIAVVHTLHQSDLNNKEGKIIELNDKIIKLEESIKEKNNQLNQTSGVILNKYGEFARFNRNNRFKEVLESFVNNKEGVDSAQIYKYSSKYSKEHIHIRVSYQEGYAYEGVDINNILQTYYSIEKNRYKQFKEIVDMWKRYLTNYNTFCKTEKECLEENLLGEIKDLLNEYHGELNALTSVEDVKDIHFDKYRIILLLVRMLSDNNNITEIENLLDKDEIEEYLNNGKRTGVLGSILLEDAYIFKHKGNNSKNGRIYICFYVEIYKENYIVLFACPPSELDYEDEEWKWNLRYESLKNDLIQRLKDTSINQQED